MVHFPTGTKSAMEMKKLLKQDKQLTLAERLSTRLAKSAAHLPQESFLGWQLDAPRAGRVAMNLFAGEGVCREDLEWSCEKIAKAGDRADCAAGTGGCEGELYELRLEAGTCTTQVGFISTNKLESSGNMHWPLYYFSQTAELVAALWQVGGTLRVCVGRADDESIRSCKAAVPKGWPARNPMSAEDYVGTPVRARALLRLDTAPTLRLRSILSEASTGFTLVRLGGMEEDRCAELWESPLSGAPTLPYIAASILMLEPVYTGEDIDGVMVCEPPAKPIAATHDNTEQPGAFCVGYAMDSANTTREITIGETDIKRHWQIIGQTGTGKSTLLATSILSAIKQGYGLTFFDPHGTTIETILHSVPKRYMKRIRVVHVGDEANPVPLSMWSSGDPVKEEKTISQLRELFIDIFDPRNQGFAGPRWERWFTVFSKASLAFLGKYASFLSMVLLSQSVVSMRKLHDAIIDDYPALAETIANEYGKSKEGEFAELINWCVCKMQRFTDIPQLRYTLGAPDNALDFQKAVDEDTVTLIDLASPVIGKNGARIIGTLALMQLWQALLARRDKSRTHLVFIDEAQLFQTNPLPYMLAEGRKFGVGIILAHQHCGQLHQEILDALEANSANFTAFRLSAKDAFTAAQRLDDPKFATHLCRIDAFNAVTTLSVDGVQTTPFTLKVEKVPELADGEEIAQWIEAKSISTLVEPYRYRAALTEDEIARMVENPGLRPRRDVETTPPEEPVFSEPLDAKKPDWLRRWQAEEDGLGNDRMIFDEPLSTRHAG